MPIRNNWPSSVLHPESAFCALARKKVSPVRAVVPSTIHPAGWHHTFHWDGGWELADFAYYFTFGARGSLPDTRVPHSTNAHSAEADVARTKRPKASGTVQRNA